MNATSSPLRPSAAGPQLDDQHPWPGLAAFDELSRAYFHGREAEVEELARRIEQSPLTVLFGKSGLGKTSLLRAGLLPLLRERRVLPVYLRLAFDAGAPPPVEQMRLALVAALADADVDAPAPATGETLWHYLHRADLEFWSRDNFLVTPLFVLDQFEEIFTLGAASPSTVRRFAVDFGDLAENRIPHDLHDTQTLRTRAMPYKLLVSLREDFLPELESWRTAIPGLGRARMRLLAMTPAQAGRALLGSGGHLMDEPLARRIVDFVAAAQGTGPADDAATASAAATTMAAATAATAVPVRAAEIEPALLSLFCRGLNERRLQQRKARFDEALLDTAKQGILADYYHSCFDGMPESVSRWVANEMITEKGFRNSVAREDATPAHLSDGQLRTLIDRRLLRLEERYGTQRIELTHDLLTRAAREARDRMRETDAQAQAAERAVAERAALEQRLQAERAAERQAAREQALLAEAAAARRFKRAAVGLAVALGAAIVASGVAVWQTRAALRAAEEEAALRAEAQRQSQLASEQREVAERQRRLADERLARVIDSIGMKQAVLSGDRERIRAYLDKARARYAAQSATVPVFGAEARAAGYRNPQGQQIYFYSLMPAVAWREQALAEVAVITYRMDHPTFRNGLLATGRESGFTARYTGWGCLTNVVVLIEYIDPERPADITEYDMCAALPG